MHREFGVVQDRRAWGCVNIDEIVLRIILSLMIRTGLLILFVVFSFLVFVFFQEMEQLKTSARSRSDIDFLRKTLRQNYDRFIAQGAGRVH